MDNGPLAFIGQNESVKINLEAVGNGVVVDARRQPAGANEFFAVESPPLRDRAQLIGRIPGMLSAAAANIDAEFVAIGCAIRVSARP